MFPKFPSWRRCLYGGGLPAFGGEEGAGLAGSSAV